MSGRCVSSSAPMGYRAYASAIQIPRRLRGVDCECRTPRLRVCPTRPSAAQHDHQCARQVVGRYKVSIPPCTSRKHGRKKPHPKLAAVLLTTLICSHLATTDFSFLIHDSNFNHLGACNIPLERYFQDLSNGILHALKFLKLQLQIQKNKTTVANPTDPWG